MYIKTKKEILVVEDKPQELAHAKIHFNKFFEKRNLQADNIVSYKTNLTEALSYLKNNQEDIAFVVTDLYFPIGQEIKHKEEFFKILGEGLYKVQEVVPLSKYGIKNKYLDQNTIDGQERTKYFLEELAKGNVADDDIPSGIILGSYAFNNYKNLNIITSDKNHGIKSDCINWMMSGGLYFRVGLIKNINEETQRKNWESVRLFRNSEKNILESLEYKQSFIEEFKSVPEIKNLVTLLDNPERYLDF